MQTYNAVSVSSEIRDLFEGMTYSFTGADGKTYETTIEGGEPETYPMVATLDGSLARRCECHAVMNSISWGCTKENWYTTEQLEEAEGRGEVYFIDSRCEYWDSAYVVWSEEEDEHLHIHDAIEIGGYWFSSNSDSVRYDHRGDAFHAEDDDYCYVESEGEWYHCDECHWSEADDQYHAGDECDCCECTPAENRINEYHHAPKPSLFRGLSPYLVGFEVEKCSVGGATSRGDYVDTKPLFSGWETDASCGVEGITHAYDPLDESVAEQFSQDLLDSADYVNAPSDSSCGGHINLSSTVHTPRELMAKFKDYAPLWYAVYRNRLNNNYCHNDKKIEHGGDKYSPVRTKSFGIEIRLPNRVHNATVLQRRFEWVGLTCQAITDETSFNAYVKSCRDLLLNGAYNGDRNKYAMILRLARNFRVWMLDGIAHESIQKWI